MRGTVLPVHLPECIIDSQVCKKTFKMLARRVTTKTIYIENAYSSFVIPACRFDITINILWDIEAITYHLCLYQCLLYFDVLGKKKTKNQHNCNNLHLVHWNIFIIFFWFLQCYPLLHVTVRPGH